MLGADTRIGNMQLNNNWSSDTGPASGDYRPEFPLARPVEFTGHKSYCIYDQLSELRTGGDFQLVLSVLGHNTYIWYMFVERVCMTPYLEQDL